ncbi:MAG: tryptophan--tRNA ligase, partial [Flavobacteriales bacterium]
KDNVFGLFKLVAPPAAVETMRTNYLRGGYGYGHAKKELLAALLDGFAAERKRYDELMNDRGALDAQLRVGAQKASEVARGVLDRVRSKVGAGPA